MRKIEKGDEPGSLTAFRKSNPHGRYDDLSDTQRQDIRGACTREQYFLCAYCCQAISGNNIDTMNEHVVAQKLAPKRTVDFSNIVASCRTPGQCDAAHASQALNLTPMMPECETEIRFKLSGRVEGMTPRATDAIRVLNLGDSEKNNKALIEKRKRLVDVLIWKNYGSLPEKLLEFEDDELLKMLLDELAKPVEGKFEAFSPALINILRGYLNAKAGQDI